MIVEIDDSPKGYLPAFKDLEDGETFKIGTIRYIKVSSPCACGCRESNFNSICLSRQGDLCRVDENSFVERCDFVITDKKEH